MAWTPDRIGPSLWLYIDRWKEMSALDEGLADGQGWESVPSDERERARAVIVTAYDQAGALLGLCIDEALRPVTEAFDLPDLEKTRRRIERIRARPPAEWTAWMEVKLKGSRARRAAGSVAISMEPDKGTPQDGKRALTVYFSLNVASEQERCRVVKSLASRAGKETAEYFEYEDGPWIYRDVVLAEGMPFADVAARVHEFAAKTIITQRKWIESALRNSGR